MRKSELRMPVFKPACEDRDGETQCGRTSMASSFEHGRWVRRCGKHWAEAYARKSRPSGMRPQNR